MAYIYKEDKRAYVNEFPDHCPRCNGQDVRWKYVNDKMVSSPKNVYHSGTSKYSVGKGLFGAAILGPIGAIAGVDGKKTYGYNTKEGKYLYCISAQCPQCGYLHEITTEYSLRFEDHSSIDKLVSGGKKQTEDLAENTKVVDGIVQFIMNETRNGDPTSPSRIYVYLLKNNLLSTKERIIMGEHGKPDNDSMRVKRRVFIYDCVKIAQKRGAKVHVKKRNGIEFYEMSQEYWTEKTENFAKDTKVVDDIIQFIINQDEKVTYFEIYGHLLENNLLSVDELDFLGEKADLLVYFRGKRQSEFIYACVKIAQKRDLKISIEERDRYKYYDISPECWTEQVVNLAKKTKVVDGITQYIIEDGTVSYYNIYNDLVYNNLLSRDELDFLGKEAQFSGRESEKQRKFVYACVKIAQKGGAKISIEKRDNLEYYDMSPEYWGAEQVETLANKTKVVDDIIQFIINQDGEIASALIYNQLLENNLLTKDELDFLGEEMMLGFITGKRQRGFVYACVEIAKERGIIEKGIKIGVEKSRAFDVYRKINEG